MNRNLRSYLIIILVTTISFLLLSTNQFYDRLSSFDLAIMNPIQQLISDRLTNIVLFITSLGTSKGVVIILACILAVLLIKKQYKYSIFLVLVNLVGAALNSYLKEIFLRPRPTIRQLAYEPSFSFPSGHAMAAIILYLSLVFVFYHIFSQRLAFLIWSLFSVIMILVMGLTRIYLGVHYPTDILGGYLAGGAFLCFAIIILTIVERKLAKN